MIYYIPRNKLNEEKYNSCILNSYNSHIYAYSWYLDCVCDAWDTLILDDYKAVMPLPKRKKYFIDYIYTPCWTQQLGVFSPSKIDSKLVHSFLNAIPKKFKKITMYINSNNKIVTAEKRINYILKLSKPYDVLFLKFSKGRKRSVIHNKERIELKNTANFIEVINLFKKNTAHNLNILKADYKKLEKLCKELLLKKKLLVITAYHKENLCGGAIFLIDNQKIVYLFSSISLIGRKENVMALIINKVIKKHENSDFVLDFEGSMVKSIAFFFKSFGAEKEIYYTYQKPFSLI